MRSKHYMTLALVLFLAGSSLLAGEETKTASPKAVSPSADLSNPTSEIFMFRDVEPNRTLAPGAAPTFRWASSTTESECPPPELSCVYYASGDCRSCGPGKTAMCHSYHCSPNYVLYTCCTCGFDVC